MHTRHVEAVLAGIFAALLCATPRIAALPVVDPVPAIPIDPPAPPGSTSPALAAEGATTITDEHEILITWLEPGELGGRLRFARLSGRDWSRPITVAEPVSTLGPTDRPSLTVIGTQAVRRTLIARTGDVIARSGDGGRTWTRLPAPALPFASFAGGEEGAYAFWLETDADGSTRLLGTRVLAGESLLDPRVAAGSGTSAAMTWDGPVVVYRDRRAGDARGVALVRRQDARWTPPLAISVTNGPPPEPPASDPRVAALRRRVAVAWTTAEVAASPRGRVWVAFSDDAGRTFNPPVEVAASEGERREASVQGVALTDGGEALVLWAAKDAPAEVSLELVRVSPGGERGEALVLARGLAAGSIGIPQLIRAGDRLAVTWIEGEPSRVRAMAVPVEEVPAPEVPTPEVVALEVAAAEGRPVVADVPAGASAAEVAKKISRGKGKIYRGRGRVGEGVPGLELTSLGGEVVSLPALAGRAVLLNLWATWCVPCRAEMPELAALHERYGPRGLEVVGVSVDDVAALDKVRAFVAEREMPFAVWLDPEMSLFRALRVKGVPVTLVIDRGGRILLRRDQPIEADDPELIEALRRALDDS